MKYLHHPYALRTDKKIEQKQTQNHPTSHRTQANAKWRLQKKNQSFRVAVATTALPLIKASPRHGATQYRKESQRKGKTTARTMNVKVKVKVQRKGKIYEKPNPGSRAEFLDTNAGLRAQLICPKNGMHAFATKDKKSQDWNKNPNPNPKIQMRGPRYTQKSSIASIKTRSETKSFARRSTSKSKSLPARAHAAQLS
jgi:hypothetical protein